MLLRVLARLWLINMFHGQHVFEETVRQFRRFGKDMDPAGPAWKSLLEPKMYMEIKVCLCFRLDKRQS